MDTICQYSDSDSDSESDTPSTIPLPRLPRLPESLSRSMAYKRLINVPFGFINSYTCTEFFPSEPQQLILKRIINNANTVCKHTSLRPPIFQPLYTSQLNVLHPLHVSLTDNFILSRDQKSQFDATLDSTLRSLQQYERKLRFEKVIVVPNNDNSSIFLALKLSTTSTQSIMPLYTLISNTIDSLTNGERTICGPVLSPQEFHVSVAKCDQFAFKLDQLQEINEFLEDVEIDEELEFVYNELKVSGEQGRLTLKLS